MLEVQHIVKTFPGVVALYDVSVEFFPGEVHSIVGENGAGKSTLMKVMAGAYQPDSGQIFFNGQEVEFNHPQEAQQAGISIIYQEFNLLPERTVAENIFLGREPTHYGVVDNKQMEADTREVLRQLEAEKLIDPRAQLGTLSVAEQQVVEIAKAISYDARVLIMDEPTAALSSNEVGVLTDLILRLKARGIAIIFISHRLGEVFDLSERITVLKDGHKIGTDFASNLTMSKVVEMMVGRELSEYFPERARPEDIGDVVLAVHAAGNEAVHDINLEIRAGEIVGVAGLQGSGRTALASAIFGIEPFETGEIQLDGQAALFQKPAQAIRRKFGYVTEDRKNEGLLLMQPINDNVLITVRTLQRWLARIFPLGLRNDKDLAVDVSEHMDVRTPSMDQEVQYLSGGNQQKVVLSKWLATDARVLIFDEPTRGIDVEAKASIHERIRELARAGTAVLMISSELPEVVGMSDRIIVMWDGTIVGELPAAATEAQIMQMATGFADGDNSSATEASKLVLETA
ncbi:MAG: sugar ABC transporter ATP-binding protein [Chloroflexota bacterium]